MSLLLGVLPFLISGFGYWTVYRGLLSNRKLGSAPSHWAWRLTYPLWTSLLTPLVLTATPSGSRHVSVLALSTAVGLVILILAVTISVVIEGDESDESDENEGKLISPKGTFFISFRDYVYLLGVKRLRLTKGRLVLLAGIIFIAYYGGLSIYIAGH